MEPHTKFKKCLRALRSISKIIFLNETERESSCKQYGFYLIITCFFICLFGCLYTIVYYDWNTKINTIFTIFGIIEVLTKYSFTKDFNALNEITAFICHIYRKNASEDNAHFDGICVRFARISDLLVKCVITFYIFNGFCYAFLNIVESVLTGKIIPVFRFYLYGIDEHTTIGITILVIHQFISLGCYVAGTTNFDALTYVIFANMPMIASTINGHLSELDNIMKMSPQNVLQIKRKQIDIICMHRKYNE